MSFYLSSSLTLLVLASALCHPPHVVHVHPSNVKHDNQQERNQRNADAAMDMEASASKHVYTDALVQPYLYALAGLPIETQHHVSDDMEDSIVEGSEQVHQKTLAKPVAFSYYKNNEVPDLTVAASDKGGPHKHYEKGGGKKHYSEHHGQHGERGKKGYKGYHHHEKGAKGYQDKESHSGSYEDKGGSKKGHHHEDGYHGEHHKGDKGQKASKFVESGKHSKGHSTKGGHNVHKTDAFEKKTVFFDESHEGGDSEKHGGFHISKKHKKGGKKKSGHKKGGFEESHHGKKGHFAKGSHHSEKKGHKKEAGHQKHHEHKEKHGKKDGKEHHTKWGHKSGDTIKDPHAKLTSADGSDHDIVVVVRPNRKIEEDIKDEGTAISLKLKDLENAATPIVRSHEEAFDQARVRAINDDVALIRAQHEKALASDEGVATKRAQRRTRLILPQDKVLINPT